MPQRAPVATALAVALAVAAGCAAPRPGTPAPAPEMRRGVEGTPTVVQHGRGVADTLPGVSPARLVAALTAVYGQLGLEITARVGTSQIASQGQRLVRLADRRASWWVDCGQDLSGPVADDARVLLNLVSTVGATQSGSVLDTRLDAEAHARGNLEGVRECTSTGRLEALLAERARATVGLTAPREPQPRTPTAP